MSHATDVGRVPTTAENRALVEAITGPGGFDSPRRMQRLILDDGSCRRVNGKYLVGNVLVLDEQGRPVLHLGADGHRRLASRRHRFRIPKNHPWRGMRPTR